MLSKERITNNDDFCLKKPIKQSLINLDWYLTQQRSWRPCWCTLQENLFKILLSWYTSMAAVTSHENYPYISSEQYYTLNNIKTICFFSPVFPMQIQNFRINGFLIALYP